MFDEALISEIKFRCEVEDVIGSYVSLQRAGSNLKGLCPFHSEKTPSFVVFPKTRSFYCFGCGAGGDVITFIRLIERLDYLESVRFLAQRSGMSMPEDEISDSGVNRRTRMLEMNREAARYFRDVLLSPEGKPGMDYLIGRQLQPNTIRRYGLGFAPEGWHNLRYYMRGKGYSDDELEAGALIVRKNNSLYDKFRNRVMFPIIDRRGNVIAFGGRTLEATAPAKYLNSDETLVFQKRENLFSLNFAKNTKESCFILCEGYMDVIALNQAGFDNAVATLGTAITPQQANLMKRYTGEVVISYDSDEAGQKATMKAINLLGEAGISARVLKIPDAKDPDEYVKRFGAESFRHILNNTADAVEFEFNKLKIGLDMYTPAGKAEFLKRAIAFLAQLHSDTERMVYCSETASATGQSASAIQALVKEKARKNRFFEQRETEKKLIRGETKRDAINPDAVKFPAEEKAERGIIAYLFHSPDMLKEVEKSITAEDFPTAFNRKVFVSAANCIKSGANLEISSIGGEFTAEEMGRITGICKQGDMLPYSRDRLRDYISALVKLREHKDERPVSEMTDDELLAIIEEKRRKMNNK